jgi:Tfp pilus assembly protein PilF
VRRREWLIALGLFAAVVFLYARTARFDYVLYDDHAYVFENARVARGLTSDNVRWALTSVHLANWHPLTTLSNLLDVSVFGLRPGPMHLENAVLHAANTALLFALLRTLTGSTWRSALVAGLFGVHPLHVESVAWISERKDVLSTLLLFLAIFAYARHVRASDAAARKKWYAAVSVLFVLAFMAKSMVVTFPAMLLLLDYAVFDRIHSARDAGRRTVEKWPLIVLSLAGCAITLAAQRSGGALRTVEEFSLGHRLANALVSYVVYIAKMFWPARLAIPYPPREHIPVWQVFGAGIVLIALTLLALTAGARRGRRRYVAAGWLWFVGTLLPVIGIVQVGNQAMADRYTYLPLIGLLVIVVWGAAELSRWSAAAMAVLAAGIVIALAASAWVQIGYWRDTRTLFTHSVDVDPSNWLGWHQLALYDVAHNDLDDADRMYERTLSLEPQSALVHTNYANNLMRQDRLADAEQHFRRALASRPQYVLALNNYGNLLIRQQRVPEAFEQFSRAVAADPTYAPAHANLGWMLLGFGQIDRAEAEFRESLRLDADLREGRRGMEKVMELRHATPSPR